MKPVKIYLGICFLAIFLMTFIIPLYAQQAPPPQQQQAVEFHAAKFTPKAGWQGKSVLAELFTGSECPPCVAADMAFDNLIEAYDTKYLVILEYHLPIPRPDPMMNPATKVRQTLYGVNSTPTVIFGGVKKIVGGGGAGNIANIYNRYTKSGIDSLLYLKNQVTLQGNAVLAGDVVNVSFNADAVLNNADYNVALVQKEENYIGANNLEHHKMVVRDFKSVPPNKNSSVSFNLKEIQQTTEKYLKEYEVQKAFTFKEMHHVIDRSQLLVVVFVQDKNTNEVYNAALIEVTAKQ